MTLRVVTTATEIRAFQSSRPMLDRDGSRTQSAATREDVVF
jgi:hypothetical protein